MLSRAEIEYYLAMTEIGLIAKETGYVGAASTTGFGNTSELRPITYEEAMSGPEKEQWKKAIKKEFDKCIRHFVGDDQYMCEENRPLKGESVGYIT